MRLAAYVVLHWVVGCLPQSDAYTDTGHDVVLEAYEDTERVADWDRRNDLASGANFSA